VPDFTLDARLDSQKLLHARKLTQKLHRDLDVKHLTEIKPHQMEWTALAKAKRDTTRTCTELLESVVDDASETRAAQVEAAFDVVNALTKNLEFEMNHRDAISDRSIRPDPYANDTTEHSSSLAEDGLTWVSSEATSPDGFALRKDEPMRSPAKPKTPTDMRGLGIGNLCRAMVRGPSNDLERRALSEGSDSTGGVNVPVNLINRVIDNTRAEMVMSAAGAQVVPLSTDSTSIAKISTDPVASFRLEAGAISESDPAFSAINFTARSCAFMFKASREVLEDALNINDLIERLMSRTIAGTVDKVALEGSGVAPEPTGLRNQSGVGHTALNAALSNYQPFVTARTGVLSANGGPASTLSIIMHPRDEGKLSGLSDTTGQPLNPPPAIAGIPVLTTSAIQIDAGAGNDESTAYVGNFSNLLIGLRNDVRVEVLRERYAENHQYAFVAHMRFDIAISHGASFHKISGIQG